MKSSQCMVILFLAIACSFQLACTEKEGLITQPPQPNILKSNNMVGSGIDSLPLEAKAITWSSGTSIIASSWRTKWTCIVSPDGYPAPVIHRSNSLSARVTGLVLGEYVFKLEFATNYGAREDWVKIQVVEDISPGTQVILDNLNWVIEAVSNAGREEIFAYTYLYNRPDLFFFRGLNRMPKVEYQDPITKQWVELLQSDETSPEHWYGYEGVTINLVDHYFSILVLQGLNEEWLKFNGQKIPVRLTY